MAATATEFRRIRTEDLRPWTVVLDPKGQWASKSPRGRDSRGLLYEVIDLDGQTGTVLLLDVSRDWDPKESAESWTVRRAGLNWVQENLLLVRPGPAR
jgi:hypothetical protein